MLSALLPTVHAIRMTVSLPCPSKYSVNQWFPTVVTEKLQSREEGRRVRAAEEHTLRSSQLQGSRRVGWIIYPRPRQPSTGTCGWLLASEPVPVAATGSGCSPVTAEFEGLCCLKHLGLQWCW